MSSEHEWEKSLLERPLREQGLPAHVIEGVHKRLREKPKTSKRSSRLIGGGVLAAGIVAMVALHGSGGWWGGQEKQTIPGQTSPSSHLPQTATSALQLGVPGPIEHYIWKHQGQTDEVWQNVEEGYWRVERTLGDGSMIRDFYKDGYLYDMHYRANGELESATKIHEPNAYNGKLSAFDGLKQTGKGLKRIGATTYQNGSVIVYDMNPLKKNPSPQEEYSKLYVDTLYQLPIKEDHIVNGSVVDTQTWSYNYLQKDDSLFTIPANVTFQTVSLSD